MYHDLPVVVVGRVADTGCAPCDQWSTSFPVRRQELCSWLKSEIVASQPWPVLLMFTCRSASVTMLPANCMQDVLATLASLMMTSLRKWDSHYDRRQRLRREQEALALHAKYTYVHHGLMPCYCTWLAHCNDVDKQQLGICMHHEEIDICVTFFFSVS